jgi:hypothetical protein
MCRRPFKLRGEVERAVSVPSEQEEEEDEEMWLPEVVES